MSYPPPLHEGTTGEPTATVRAAGAAPEPVHPHGNPISLLATGATTAASPASVTGAGRRGRC